MISIIIPIYNSEQYIYDCISSIISQSFKDLEVILIDDGSTDKSFDLCQEFVKKDKRIKLFHKSNGGVSSARNLGIEKASGEWFFFSDSDDLLMPNALQTMYYATVGKKHDFYMFGFEKIQENGGKLISSIPIKEKTITRDDSLQEMFKASDYPYQGFLWCKLFKREIINKNHLLFDTNVAFNEDRLFIVDYLCHIENPVFYTTKPVYQYIERESSAMISIKTGYNKKFATDFDAFCKIIRILKKNSINKTIINMAKDGAIYSYTLNHELMISNRLLDNNIHKQMSLDLIKNGLFVRYLFSITKKFIRALLVLFFPKILIK